VPVWTCIIITLFGARLYLEPHLEYPVTIGPGEWCTEWVACADLARELKERGCEGRTELIALFLEPLDRPARLISMMLSRGANIDVRGIEHRSETFAFDVDRWSR